MAEYSREQRNQLSRVVANNGVGSRQMKDIIDSRVSNHQSNMIRLIQLQPNDPPTVDDFKDDIRIIYGDPSLDERECRDIIVKIEKGEPIINSNTRRRDKIYEFESPEVACSHEWGIYKLVNGECILVCGYETSVPSLPYDGKMIAHSHPYFIKSSCPNGLYMNRPTLYTKEIPTGSISWNDLIGDPNAIETLKIFPSCKDIVETANFELSPHTVYTAYKVRVEKGNWIIYNPNEVPDEFRRLNFRIENARKEDSGNNYACTLYALQDDYQFWNKEIKVVESQYKGFDPYCFAPWDVDTN